MKPPFDYYNIGRMAFLIATPRTGHNASPPSAY
jgi:hypothetical protein